MGMIIFDLWPHEGCWRPKTPIGNKKRHEEVYLLKRKINKVSQQPQKPFLKM